jgi:hypothetical protein
MKGWLDNYNDSKVSVPQGFVGDGYDTTGRDYSPAWGGQFQDGGFIPIAQKGRATAADSLDIYNRSLKIDAYYNNLKKKGWYPKRKITPTRNLTSEDLEDEMKSIDKESRETYKKQSKEIKEYSRLKNVYPTADPKKANLNALREHIALTKGTRYATKDNLPSIIDPMAPTTVIDTRIIPKERVHYETIFGSITDAFYKKYPNPTKTQEDKLYKEIRKLGNLDPPSGTAVNLYRYDPLSVKPWNMLTDAEKKLRVQKYGTDGVPKSYIKGIKDKLNKDPEVKPEKYKTVHTGEGEGYFVPINNKPILQPKVEAVNIQPIEQRPIIPNQQIDVRTPAQMPSSFDVSMQRYNMQGPSDYYNTNQEGVDYETAMQIKLASDTYNKSIEEKYGPQNEYRTEKSRQEAARRLEKLRQDVKVRPNYQMGGNVYPVNYIPEAQNGFTSFMSDLGDSIAEFFSDDKKEKIKSIKPIKQPVVKKSGNKDNTRTLNISDPRKILATTNQPLRPNSDLVSGKYSSKHLDRLLQEAKRQGLSKKDMLDLSAMGFQETKWGKSDDNIGHVKGDWEGDDSYQQFISAYKEKMKLSDKLGIKDPALRLQVYNGLGTITPKTEKDYHGFEMKKIYGVPVPKEGINMKKNPLYGKQVMDIRDNVLAKNPEYLRYMDSIYKAPVPKYMEDIKVNKPSLLPDLAMGGSIPGAVGFSYARTNDPAPSNGPYAKKTKASAQDGETLQYGTPEYKKAYNENRVAYYDKDSDTYINQELAPIEVQGRVRDKGFWEQYVDNIVEENRGASPLEAAIGVPISAVSSLPQIAATYAFTGEVQRPSEAMDIENPYLAMGTDFVLDPLNVTGTGLLTKERALARLAASKGEGLLSNAWRLNPKAYQYNLPENTMWRGIGKEGMKDATQSGVFRPKNAADTKRVFTTPNGTEFHFGKSFDKTYYSPDFKIADRYGKSYIAEVPNTSADFTRRYSGKDWSYHTNKQIPISEGRILEKNWLQGYKEIPKQEDGGVIKDDRGQWAHPGEITEIGSNQITMQGVPYPVLGVSDEGDVQMMYPEEDYEFIGNTVTEYPMAEDGIQTTTDQTTYPWSPGNKNKNRGDQLANFKNQPQQEKPKPKPNTFVDKLIAESAERKNNINLRELPPIAVNDNIPNAHNMAVKADAALVKQQQYEKIVKVKEAKAQADAQKKFNALPKAEQERIINEQRNQQYGSVTQYEPEGFWEKAGNIALTPFTALREKIQRGHVPDNLVKGIMNDPKNRLNPMDVAYLATLGYAAAPYVAQGTTAVGTAVAPYLAADAVIGGTTLTGVNAHNLIAAGFATHGLMNAGPDAVAWAENPSWEKAGHVAMDVAEVLPVAGPASKMVGEGFGLVKNKANQILTKASEVTAPVMTKGKTLIDDMGAVISGERKTIGPKLDALNDVGLKIYESDEYIKMTQESHQLQQKRWALEAKMNNLKTKGSRTEIDNLNNKITNLQKRIDVAEQFKVNGDGLIQSGKNTALGLRTGSTDIMDLSTGEKFRISTSVPTSDVIHTLEGEKVVKTLDNSKLPQVTPEYTSTVKKNIDFIETQIPGAKVFGSAKNVAEAEVPHIIGDYDVIMSQSQYNKFAKANPVVGNNGLADLHNIPGAAKGTKPIDINVIQEKAGKAVGTRAEELFKQVAPDEYYAAAKQAIQNKSEIKIPYSSQELVDMTNPTTKSVVDAYESTKTKHINKIDALINYGKPSVVAEGQQQFVKSLVGSKGSIGHQFPVEQLSNAEANVEILDKIGFIGNKKLIAADPERMQLAINDYYMNNSILARQVDDKKINTIEKAIKEYYPGAGGGNANGIGQNHVMLGHPYHGDGNIISMKQLGMNLDTKDPMSYINSIEHNVSGQKLFSEEERTILSNIIDDIKGLDDVSKITAKNSKNTSNLINNLPYSETGKQALYDFAKQTGRTIVKKEREYGNSVYASTLRDFDEAIDVMQYQVENSEKAIKSYRQRSDAARYAENSRGLSSDLELLPKQFKAIKGYVDGGIEKANERLVAAKFERTRISDEIQAISSKAFKNKYWEEINRLKETQTKIEKEIQDISQMRRDLFDRKNHLNKLEDNMKSVGILGGGTATLLVTGTIAYKNDQEMQKEWDWTVTEETKEALRVEEEKKKKEAERNADKLKKQNGGTITKAKNGLRQEQKGLVNLDNLTNFTNYNTKQPGGWLDKYN